MTVSDIGPGLSSFPATDHGAFGALLAEIANAASWEKAELMCVRALPTSEVYSLRPVESGWSVEIEYDNLLHEGTGSTELLALSDALRGILEVLQLARLC